MLDKMLGVSPPQKGLAQDSGAVDKKTLQQHADLKKEFDQKLKEQQKDRSQGNANSAKDSKKDQKEKVDSKDELRADRNQKKPSGGPKKKMVEPEEQNEKTISNVMASIESEVEIADQRKDLAPVESESSTEIKNDSKVGMNPTMQTMATEPGQQGEAQVTEATALAADGAALSKLGDAKPEQAVTDDALVQQALAAKNGAKSTAVEITPEMIAAFRAAQENATGEVSDKTQTSQTDAQLALQMQALAQQQQSAANAASTAASASATAVPKSVDTSSLLAKSLENLKSMSSASNAANVAAPIMASAMGVAAYAHSGDDAQIDTLPSEEFNQMAAFDPIEDLQTEQTMQNISNDQLNKMQQAKAEELTFEQQLGAEVGFEPEEEVADSKDTTKSALLQKMKAFEAEKGLTQKEANAFEIKVLAMLQQERNQMVSAKQTSGEGFGQGGFSNKEGRSDSMKELSSQALGSPDASLHAGQLQPGFKSHMNTLIDRAGMPTTAQAMAEHREENIQHVMSSAKLLAIKGGGEMVVKMSPDGMGPLELKVMMQDGKVNIEMQTQDKSVKKLIEESLTELKSGLAAQKIHVDHVKIDTVNATHTENSTNANFQSNQNSSDAQGRQQEFWKNFRENFGNQGRRSSYGEVGSIASRQPAAPNALSPVTGSGAARSTGRTGSTINRVA